VELHCTGSIFNGGERFASLLNLDGVDGVFGGHSSAPSQPGRPNPQLSINLSLLDEDGGADLGGDIAGGSFDRSSWGLGLPSVSEATSSVRHRHKLKAWETFEMEILLLIMYFW
jgi:hypothetical protein